jgi:hypothetical protein
MRENTRDILDRLARRAEAVCAEYLSAGCREGRYWLVGDIDNSPGRSLFVGLSTGKWLDGHTGEHGDLLDIIRYRARCGSFGEAIAEARRFLAMPPAGPFEPPGPPSAGSAQRLFRASRPLDGTLALHYLRGRGITAHPGPAVRFHPRCYVRATPRAAIQAWPAIVAALTDGAGRITGVHRHWLARDGRGKAPFPEPKRSIGVVLGSAVRVGQAAEILAAGEGLETVLSPRSALPGLAVAATTSAAHLGAFRPPAGVRRLYVMHDGDAAADEAFERLQGTCRREGAEAIALRSPRGDLNQGLYDLGFERFRAMMLEQLASADRARLAPSGIPGREEERAA